MRILAIETAGLHGSVAALARDRLLAERPLDVQRRSAQSLAPAMAELLHEVGWQPREVELVAVATGPGSFTGLRIGVTTAKAFAYAAGCQLIGVHTLAAIAARAGVDRVWAVLDAERGELFAAEFARDETGGLHEVTSTQVVAKDVWLAALAPGSVVSGPGLERLSGQLPPSATTVASALWGPTASAVGSLGWKLYEAGERGDVFGLVPNYFRRTAAEEKRDRGG